MDTSNPSTPKPESCSDLPELTPVELATYSWQLPVAGFGELGQRRLKGATVLISRIGGLGGVVAQQLAAAGIGRLVLAHGGDLRPDDLNRQLLMKHAGIGRPRMDAAVEWLRSFNPRLDIVAVPSNVTETNARELVAQADVVVDCAPLFAERYLLNRESVAQRKPMVECAVYELEFHLTVFVPGETPCLRCLYPDPSTTWTRRFPVFGAVSGTAGGLAAMETIKLIAGFGHPLKNRLLSWDLRSHRATTVRIRRLAGCPDCGAV